MMQQNLSEVRWRRIQCPFETVKKFKTGFSLKCPRTSQICWVAKDKVDDAIFKQIIINRDCECRACKEDLLKFLEVKP